ncbi:MAG: MoaD/ThiS family protein [Chloroflexi bacterium]|nr:MoaD/ThiS family protein [Chloroflexota bacterium]
MARVWVPAQLVDLCGGRRVVDVPGRTVGEVLRALDRECPGLAERLLPGGTLAPDLAVSVDGAIGTLGLLEPVTPTSEVYLVPALQGGATTHGEVRGGWRAFPRGRTDVGAGDGDPARPSRPSAGHERRRGSAV